MNPPAQQTALKPSTLTEAQIATLDDLISDIGWDASDVGDAQGLLIAMRAALTAANAELARLKGQVVEPGKEWRVWKSPGGALLVADCGNKAWSKWKGRGDEWAEEHPDTPEWYVRRRWIELTDPAERAACINSLPMEGQG